MGCHGRGPPLLLKGDTGLYILDFYVCFSDRIGAQGGIPGHDSSG